MTKSPGFCPTIAVLDEHEAFCAPASDAGPRCCSFAGEPWTEAEHAAFLAGLRQLGKVGTVSILDLEGC